MREFQARQGSSAHEIASNISVVKVFFQNPKLKENWLMDVSPTLRRSDNDGILRPSSMRHLRRLTRQMLASLGCPCKKAAGTAPACECPPALTYLPVVLDLTVAASAQMLAAANAPVGTFAQLSVPPMLPVHRILKIKKVPGAAPEDSLFVDGPVFNSRMAHKSMVAPKRIPRVLTLAFAIDYPSTLSHFVSLDSVFSQEKDHLMQIVGRIVALRPDVVFTMGSVCKLAVDLLVRAGVAVAANVKLETLHSVARCSGSRIAATPNDLTLANSENSGGKPAVIGLFEKFSVRVFDDVLIEGTRKSFVFLEGCSNEPVGTVILRGASLEYLISLKRVMKMVLFIAFNLVLEQAFLDNELAWVPNEVDDTCLDEENGPVPEKDAATTTLESFDDRLQNAINTYNSTYVSASPFVKFPVPHILQRLFELKSDKTPLASNDQTIISLEINCANYFENLSTLSPFHFQKLVFLFSSVSMASMIPCHPPDLNIIEYYSHTDMCVGGYVQEFCENHSVVCPAKGCGLPMSRHLRTYAHGSGRITVSLEDRREGGETASEPKSRPHGGENIQMWSVCTICGTRTPRVDMSWAGWKYSFGKWLELMFYMAYTPANVAKNGSMDNESFGNCPHDLHRDHMRLFSYGKFVVRFEFQVIDLLEVYVPPMKVTLNAKVSAKLAKDEYETLRSQVTSFYDSIQKRTKRMLAVTSSSGQAQITRAAAAAAEILIHRAKEEKATILRLTDDIWDEQNLAISDGCANFALTTVLHKIYANAVKWETEFERLFDAELGKTTGSSVSGTTGSGGSTGIVMMPTTSPTAAMAVATVNAVYVAAGAMASIVKVGKASDSRKGKTASSLPAPALTLPPENPPMPLSPRMRQAQHPFGSLPLPLSLGLSPTQFFGNYSEPQFSENKPDDVVDKIGVDDDIFDLTSLVSGGGSVGAQASSVDKEVDTAGCGYSGEPPDALSEIVQESAESLLGEDQVTNVLNVPQDEREMELVKSRLEHIRDDGDKSIAQMNESGELVNSKVEDWSNRILEDEPLRIDPESEQVGQYNEADGLLVLNPSQVGISPGERSSALTKAVQARPKLEYPFFTKNRDKPKLSAKTQSNDSVKEVGKDVIADDFVSDQAEVTNEGAPADIEEKLTSGKGDHIKLEFSDGGTKFECKAFYAEQFEALRRNCGFEDGYLQSLSRCIKWDASGGKSGSAFLKTKDDRLILKSLSRPEMEALLKFAPSYFTYVSEAFFHKLHTVLAKTFGFYRIGFKSPNKSFKMDVLVMENLFWDRKITQRAQMFQIFDLKGSMRNRHVQSTGKRNQVLLDENLLEYLCEYPLFIREYSKRILRSSVWNDTLFLYKMNVMDYSLLVGIDEENKELVVGIVGFGAAYGTAKSGVGISAMGVMRPEQVMKNIVPVVMAGIIGIYGLVVSVLVSGNLSSRMTLFAAFIQLGAGLSVGLSGLAAGFAVGVVGDAGVRGTAQQPRLYDFDIDFRGSAGVVRTDWYVPFPSDAVRDANWPANACSGADPQHESRDRRFVLGMSTERAAAYCSGSGGGGGGGCSERARPRSSVVFLFVKKLCFHPSGDDGPWRRCVPSRPVLSPTLCYDVGAIVLDVGASSVKAGHAGIDTPSAVFPAAASAVNNHLSVGDLRVWQWSENAEIKHAVANGQVTDWSVFEALCNHAFSERLFVDSMSEHPLLISEAAWASRDSREKLIELAFETFKVPAFYVAKAPVLSAFSAGKATALVIDSGADCTSVVPVVDGFVLKKAIQRNSIAGNAISAFTKSLFEANRVKIVPHYNVKSKVPITAGQIPPLSVLWGRNATSSFHDFATYRVLDEFKESVLQVSEFHFNQNYLQSRPPRSLRIPEIMFNPTLAPQYADGSVPGLQQLVHAALTACDPELRATLFTNVVVTGGNSLLPGFIERLNNTMSHSMGMKHRIHAAGSTAERKYASWIGGSILGSLGNFHQMWISKAEYDEKGVTVEKR
ncbi:1-phosphatidylinositol-3-phosphate 5-kinase, partial [Entophlyctis luteolus]